MGYMLRSVRRWRHGEWKYPQNCFVASPVILKACRDPFQDPNVQFRYRIQLLGDYRCHWKPENLLAGWTETSLMPCSWYRKPTFCLVVGGGRKAATYRHTHLRCLLLNILKLDILHSPKLVNRHTVAKCTRTLANLHRQTPVDGPAVRLIHCRLHCCVFATADGDIVSIWNNDHLDTTRRATYVNAGHNGTNIDLGRRPFKIR